MSPRRWAPIPRQQNTSLGKIETPVRFQARFPSPCAACGKTMDAGEMVAGVRGDPVPGKPRGKWTVWHDRQECWDTAQSRGLYGGAPAVEEVGTVAPIIKRTKPEEDWLREFDSIA